MLGGGDGLEAGPGDGGLEVGVVVGDAGEFAPAVEAPVEGVQGVHAAGVQDLRAEVAEAPDGGGDEGIGDLVDVRGRVDNEEEEGAEAGVEEVGGAGGIDRAEADVGEAGEAAVGALGDEEVGAAEVDPGEEDGV
jgi:hypothetical protein